MSGPTTMEGYLYKKGHALPIMQRRYCVLKGTMLAYYTNKEDFTRKLTPRNVLEVVGIKDLSESGGGFLSPSKKANAFEIEYLGGTTYTCQADSREEKLQWLSALQHALDEPDRIVQDEIEDAQRHLQQEAEKEDHAMALAGEAVEKAQQLADEALAMDAAIKNAHLHRAELIEQLSHAKILLEESHKKTEQTKTALQRARVRAHDAVLDDGEDKGTADGYERDDVMSVASATTLSQDEMANRIAQLAAQLEVDHTSEATQLQHVTSIEMSIKEYEQQIDEFEERAKRCAAEGRKLRETAAVNLQSAQSAKNISRLRVSSWTVSSSHLDPLAEGYLLCKHPMKPSMHRRYYVLYGNTLCWYKDTDDYNQHTNTPSGVVHVSAVTEWNGKVGGMKTFPHAFAIATVEGKTLYCSAPMKQSAVTWDTALHIGLTMPALSPHRAMQAKARRDSFDLLSSTVQSPQPGSMQRRASLAHVSSTEKEHTSPNATIAAQRNDGVSAASDRENVVVEGYLVKKSSLFPAMKKKYCVLNRLRFGIFESHEHYAASRTDAGHGDHEEVIVCGVSDWDGHGAMLQYHHGFQIHTVNHHIIQCSASNENEKTKWVTGIHEAMLRFKDQLQSPSRREEELLENARSSILATVQLSDTTASALATSETFRRRVRQVYVEHHPAKVHDVPMLIEKYAGREGALIAHLDRIFGTEMGQDAEVQQLVQTLESSTQETHRGRRRLSSGVNSGLREFGKMMGYLKWKPSNKPGERPSSPAASSFCVLSVDKLVRYTSETAYMTEPFNALETIQLLGISDHSTESSSSFCVTYCRVETDGKPPSRPTSPISPKGTSHEMELDALTEEQRTLWMAKIRSGLGIVETAQATSPTSVTAPNTSPQSAIADVEGLRRKLIDYYRRHNPRRVAEIDTLLHYFAGREKLLLIDLDATYGTSISTETEFISLLPDSTLAEAQDPRDKMDSLRYESYLWVKHPMLGSGFQKCYCVMRNTRWYCFENSRDAHAHLPSATTGTSDGKAVSPRAATKPPLLEDTVVNLNNLNAKLHSMRVFNIEGEAYGAILLRADVDPLFQDWTKVLRKAADAHQQLETPIEEEHMPGWWRALHDKLTEFYRSHQPAKVHEVGNILRSFEGREGELLEEIDRIHNTQIAKDPDFVGLIPSGDSSDSVVEGGETILMEGYLVKRGHLVPSMRKRYCVLVKNILTYYLTHEDSRSSDVQPLGSFRVEIVSDWHGKTTTQTYEHGMELETHDGKTFFCAAFSSEEKTQWMRAFHHGVALARSETVAGSDTIGVSADQDNTQETEEDRKKRDQFREKLVAFYQEHNPRKLVDLDLLLACYKGRELAMLEAMDATYGSQLLHDEAMLNLLPPLNAHTQALRRLEYDGPLERAAGGNSDAAWKHIQRVYVSQKGLTLTFYASREGFKAGAAALTSAADKAVTVLAVKPVDNPCRFAVETTEHIWMYFQAPNVLEKAHWLQLLQAALDAMLAKTILEEERLYLEQQEKDASSPRGSVLIKGFLMVRMDFLQSLEDFRQLLQNLSDTSASPASPKKDPRLGDSKASVMQECYVVLQNHNELSLYSDENRSEAIATVTVVSTRAWKAIGGVAPMSSDSATVGRFPFQILTHEQVVLSCGAATDLDRAKWIQQTRRGAQQAAALEMLHEQFGDDQASDDSSQPKRMERRRSTLDDKTGELRGYLYYQSPIDAESTSPEVEQEGYLVLNKRASMRIYTDESAFLRGDDARYRFQVLEIAESTANESVTQSPGGHFRKLFKGFGNSPKNQARYVLQLQVVHESNASAGDAQEQTLMFFPATRSEQSLWESMIRAGINTRKGEQLLSDEMAVLAIENAHISTAVNEADGEEPFVQATSAMEGELTMWRVNEASERMFAMLTHCKLLGFVSREVAAAFARGTGDHAPLVELTIDSIAEWNPPGEEVELQTSRGFQVQSVADKNTGEARVLLLTAPTPRAMKRWVHAIQHEINFALAEQYLDEDAKEFARLAAAHVAAAGAQSEPGVSPSVAEHVVPTLRLEGYVRVRHQFVGSMWRERFAVIMGTSLWFFKDGGDACADDWLRRAIERHELISAQEWQPSGSGNSRDGQDRHGLRLENQDGVSLELMFPVQHDRDAWFTAIKTCLENVAAHGAGADRFISRDAALPFVPGAAMEGYLKVREKSRKLFARTTKWATRYGVLIGTQWLLYETQQQALLLHGHNQQGDAAEQKEEGDDILPQSVFDIIHAEVWQASSNKKMRSGDEDLEAHGFIVVANKSSAFGAATMSPSKTGLKIAGDITECKAQTSLERKRWLNAMEDQITSVQREQDMVRRAMEQHKEKTAAQQAVKTKFQNVRDDANRQSLYIKDVLASLDAEATTSEEEEESDGEAAQADEDKVHGPLTIRSRSIGRVRSPENSPMYRTDLQERQGGPNGAFFGEEENHGYVALGSPSKGGKKPPSPWWSLQSLFACCFDRPPSNTGYAASVAPLKNPKYVYEYYSEDKPSSLDDF